MNLGLGPGLRWGLVRVRDRGWVRGWVWIRGRVRVMVRGWVRIGVGLGVAVVRVRGCVRPYEQSTGSLLVPYVARLCSCPIKEQEGSTDW